MHDELDNKARNRENQRRSRQRQREYTAELEAKLAEYERDGAQASKLMQAAARSVAEENVKLRDLLGGLGATREAVDACLAGSLSGAELKALLQLDPSSIASSSTGLPREAGQQVPLREACGTATASACTDHGGGGGGGGEQELCRQNSPAPVREQQRECLLTVQPPVPEQTGSRGETDCEDAAKIIANMRGGIDSEDLRSELGCDRAGKCFVNNARLFDLIDR